MSCCSEAATSYSWSYELASCFALFPFFFLLWKQDTSDLFYTPGPVPCWDTVPLSWLVVLPASRAGRCETMTPTCFLFLTTRLDLGVRLPILTETVKKMRNSVHLMGLEEEASLHISPIRLSGGLVSWRQSFVIQERGSFEKSTMLWILSPQQKGCFSSSASSGSSHST